MTAPAPGSERTAPERLGVVVIGRNEGERLRRCLGSLLGRADRIVYVDSGSSDGSVELARSLGVEVVALDTARPFSMARGRNAGFAHLRAGGAEVDRVQFVDGDCEVAEGWLERARTELASQPRAAVVCGRRRERHPEASLYNRLIDMEWERPLGVVKACGGDAMMRVAPLAQAGGFDETMIAGEERELCGRLRRAGWEVRSIGAEMTLHDVDLRRFGQWWRRCERTGHAYAEGALKAAADDPHNARGVRSALLWGAAGPAAILGLLALAAAGSGAAGPAAAGAALAYPLMALRIARGKRRQGRSPSDALVYGLFCMLAKPAQALGIARFGWNHTRRRPSALIEYR